MASWDTPVVSSPSTANYAAPLVNFDEIGKLPETYLKMKEMRRQDDVANAFRGGIPRVDPNNPNSAPDYNAMSERMLQLGNFPEATTLQSTGIEMQRMRNGQRIADQYFSPGGPAPASTGQPSPAGQPTSSAAASQPAPQGRLAPTAPTTIRMVLQAHNIPNDQWDAVAPSIARQLDMTDDKAPIDTSDPRVRNVLVPALKRLKGVGQVVSPDQPTQPQPQATPTERVSQGFTDAGVPAHGVPDGSQAPQPSQVEDTARSLGLPPKAAAAVQSRLDAMSPAERKATLSNWAMNPALPKSLSEFAEKRLEAIERGEEPTTEIKNTGYDAATGGALTRHEAGIAGAKADAEAPYKIAQAAVREGGRPVAIKPGEVVTTGSQLDPALSGITDWASKRMGAATGSAPAAPPPPPQGAPRPGSVPAMPAPPLASTSAAPTPDQPARSAFTPQMIRNPDGSVASNITPSTDTLQKTAATNYEKAREAFSGAQEVQSQLTNMENGFRKLNAAGWSSTGSGAEAKLQLAKAANSIWQTLGVKDQNLPFDPSTVGSWEALTKDTTRLGFALSRTLGAREAMQVVAQAVNANPSIKNTPLGAKMVLNTIRQNAERQSDYFEYATRYAQTHGGDLIGAETSFSKLNPPTLYARRAIVQAQKDIPQEAVEQLRNDPNTAPAFDEHYGSKGLANMFLGNARLQGLQ